MTVQAYLEPSGNLVVETPVYRILFAKSLGYAGRELTITAGGAQRLDRFDRPGEGEYATCMCFENLVVSGGFQQGYYPKENHLVQGKILDIHDDRATVEFAGGLVALRDDTPGKAHFRKRITFQRDSYRVELSVEPPEGSLRYIGIWWDVNDRWVTYMRSSAGVLLPLRPRFADAVGEAVNATFKPFREMDRGEGAWMEVGGPLEAIHVRLVEPRDLSRVRGGMKFWDGPDEDGNSWGVSHACINLDLFSDLAPEDIGQAPQPHHYTYEVQLVPAISYH